MFNQGIYEQLINKLVAQKLEHQEKLQYYIQQSPIEKAEAAQILSNYLANVLNLVLSGITGEDCLDKQIEMANKVILLLKTELNKTEIEENLIEAQGKILNAVFSKINPISNDLAKYVSSVTPHTGLIQSELFTGGNAGISLDSELRREILSANKICFLISFIKWEGYRLLEKELNEFTSNGGKLQVITTTYIGATDAKAIEFLSNLPNTEIKVSYNSNNERLHAKAYLFLRDSGFHTGYIGSSNFSRTALTSGLEWNLKITTKEIPHIIGKFQKIFDTYWADTEFEPYKPGIHLEKLQKALRQNKSGKIEDNSSHSFFEIKPFPFQKEILEKLETERIVHKRTKNLIVAATGTGKTVISAFDFKNFRKNNPNAKLLFVAHRKEILQQARNTFAGILRDNNFGELWVDGEEPTNFRAVFASVQTLKNKIATLLLSKDYFDFIVIDEVHHIAANSYRPILDKFSPQILLGLTATPERMDGANILEDFCGVIAAEIRLPEALNRKLLCPFQYFGITDRIDISNVQWLNGRYSPSELTDIYTHNDFRVDDIICKCQYYLTDFKAVRALGFCVSKEHAVYMAEKFNLSGIRAGVLISDSSNSFRDNVVNLLRKKEINYLFVVDIFNEGIDIPEVDTILFLRPTESLTVFLQQLGRGLRLHDDKSCLTILDFVGNARPEYDFESKFRALIGKTNKSTLEEVENDFPYLPLGCSIVLEKKAKDLILENIKKATQLHRNHIITKITNFRHQTSLSLTLNNFIDFYNIPIQAIYKRGCWSRLCAEAKTIADYQNINEKEIQRVIEKKWTSCNSYSYLTFILQLAEKGFVYPESPSKEEELMLLMLHYDVWQDPAGFDSLNESIFAIGRNPILVKEIIETLTYLIDKIAHIELNIDLPYPMPLKAHSRYTKDQILAAFGENTFLKKSSNREGVVPINSLNSELLLVTLEKTEHHYSPSTMYDDYAINEKLFHWQSQNKARPEIGVGLSYIQQEQNEKSILLFVRESNEDTFKNTVSFVFLGKVNYVSHYGSKPMSINWKLEEPIPPYIWKETAKMAVG